MKRNFTLIEMLIVVVIIAILAGMIVANAGKTRARVRQLLCGNNMKQISIACASYRSDNDCRPFSPYFLNDFRPLSNYCKSLKIFVCPGSPYSVGKIEGPEGLFDKTDYLLFQGDICFEDIEKSGNGNNVGVYGFEPGNPKFLKVQADKDADPAIYDRYGPAHFKGINICYLDDNHLTMVNTMERLWTLKTNGQLNLDSVTQWPEK